MFTRRSFNKSVFVGAIGSSVIANASQAQKSAANDKLQLGFILGIWFDVKDGLRIINCTFECFEQAGVCSASFFRSQGIARLGLLFILL